MTHGSTNACISSDAWLKSPTGDYGIDGNLSELRAIAMGFTFHYRTPNECVRMAEAKDFNERSGFSIILTSANLTSNFYGLKFLLGPSDFDLFYLQRLNFNLPWLKNSVLLLLWKSTWSKKNYVNFTINLNEELVYGVIHLCDLHYKPSNLILSLWK